MSAILKALKKVEATVGQPGSPPLPGPVDPRMALRREPRPAAWIGRTAVGVGIGLILAGGIWGYFKWKGDSPAIDSGATPRAVARSNGPLSRPVPEPEKTSEASKTLKSGNLGGLHPPLPSSRSRSPETVRTAVRPELAPSPPRPERPIRRAVAGAVQPEEKPSEVSKKSGNLGGLHPPPRPAPAVRALQSQAPAPAETVAARPSPEPVDETPSPAVPQDGKETRLAPQPETNPSPSVPRRVDERIRIQALVWADAPADRMAMVNGTIIRIGGTVGEVAVVDIGDDYLILDDNNTRWRQPFQLK